MFHYVHVIILLIYIAFAFVIIEGNMARNNRLIDEIQRAYTYIGKGL